MPQCYSKTRMIRWCVAVSGVSILLTWTITHGIRTGTGHTDGPWPQNGPGRSLKVYGARDLLTVPSDYDPTTGSLAIPLASKTKAQLTSELMAQVRLAARDPKEITLYDTGRDELIIMASNIDHTRIAALLEALRVARTSTASIECKAMRFRPGIVEQLPADVRALLAKASDASAGNPISSGPTPIPSEMVSPLLAAIMEHSAGTTDFKYDHPPRLQLQNGQQAYVLISTQRSYVSGFNVVTGGNSATSYTPDVNVAEDCLMLDARATIDLSSRKVNLMFHPKISAVRKIENVPFKKGPLGETLMIGSPNVRVSELRTTMTVNDGGTFILYPLADPENDERRILLVVTTGIIDRWGMSGGPTSSPTTPPSRGLLR